MEINVFKFGGASVNSAEAVRNVARIVERYRMGNLVVVVSAMGKTTNALEHITNLWFHKKAKEVTAGLREVESFHTTIARSLFPDPGHPVFRQIEHELQLIRNMLSNLPRENFDMVYDQVVSSGELLSTRIIASYLNEFGLKTRWMDARKLVHTDATFRDARVDWRKTTASIRKIVLPVFSSDEKHHTIALTQGFIGRTKGKLTTTLGREGSDFTAAIFAYALEASQVVIWKDVPGLMNADPKIFKATKKLPSISYNEAIELAYYGAQVIHPKTIQPLQNKDIPLFIKSFLSPQRNGSLIHSGAMDDGKIPSFIFKFNQVLISISPRDFSFITENNLHFIFGLLTSNHIKVNLMQNSAISFSICVDHDERKINALLDALKENYLVRYNTGVHLITIRHYTPAAVNKVVNHKKIFLEQKSRSTIQMVVK